MTNNLENHFYFLQREIYDITQNINKVRNKNHKTVSHIVDKIKNFSQDLKPFDLSIESNDSLLCITKNNNCRHKYNNYLKTYTNRTNYKKYKPVIHLYKSYKNCTENCCTK